MKKRDIKRLERAAELYKKIEELLDAAYDSIEDGNDCEYIEMHDMARTCIYTTSLVNDMLIDAKTNREWIESKVEMIKEQLT